MTDYKDLVEFYDKRVPKGAWDENENYSHILILFALLFIAYNAVTFIWVWSK